MEPSSPILIEVPVCAFRPYTSREYQDSYPLPPPTTVYGMLLSLIGVDRSEKQRHRGAEVAIATERLADHSRVFRKFRRGADLENTRPDYQDLLIDMRFWLWLRKGEDEAHRALSSCVLEAISNPMRISRFGGLSLGESSYLVDSIKVEKNAPDRLIFLKPDPHGYYSLPVWIDHVDSSKSVYGRFEITDTVDVNSTLNSAWVRIGG